MCLVGRMWYLQSKAFLPEITFPGRKMCEMIEEGCLPDVVFCHHLKLHSHSL